MELIKQTIKVGNSAGVLLPKQYLNSKVKIILEPLNIEKDVLDIVGEEHSDKPIVLDFESIRVNSPGKYDLDLVAMFKGKPLVYKLDDGKYVVDIVSTFERRDS